MTDRRARPWPLLIARAVLAAGIVAETVIFAGDLAAGSVSNASADAFAVALTLVLAVGVQGAVRRVRTEARPVASSPAEPPKTHAESVAEAVEAIRQRQWDAIAERAYLAAGGTARKAESMLPAAASVSMADMVLGVARLGAALGPCAHANAVPVDLLVTGERVAWICPDCPAELPAGWA